MDQKDINREMSEQQKYVVHGFCFGMNDDLCEMEVRRYDKCFFISLAPENFESSTSLKAEYLRFLDGAKIEMRGFEGDVQHADDEEPYHLEDFYDWALEPCLPLFESMALAPENANVMTLSTFLNPQMFSYSLRAVGGKLVPISVDEERFTQPQGVELDDDAFHPSWPLFHPSEIGIFFAHPEDAVRPSPNKVLLSNNEVSYFKQYEAGDKRRALHELAKYKEIQNSKLRSNARICRLRGIVKNDENLLLGLLLTYIDCGYVTLVCAALAETRDETSDFMKQKWVDQVTNTISELHAAGIVWDDAKPDNVLIDKNRDAWIIDFGGSYTRGYVEADKAGTIEGDLQGLANIKKFVFEGKV